jgi:hypothetical protein
MRTTTYRPREFVVEFPDDGGASIDAMLAFDVGEGTSVWLGEWLLYLADDVMAVHARLAFSHLRLTSDRRFIVPDVERPTLGTWIASNPGREPAAWSHLEVVTPWNLLTLRRWSATYYQVLKRRPRVRSLIINLIRLSD